MSRILKGLAIAAGAGVAMSCGSMLASRQRNHVSGAAVYGPDQVLDLEPLLDRLEGIERRIEQQDAAIAALRINVADVEQTAQQIPVVVDAAVDVRVEHIQAGMDEKISRRMAAIERTLTDQSNSITALREKADASDAHMQRLILAIERLCERTPAQPEPAAFQAQLDQALENPKPQQEFRARIFKEESDAKKPRMPWAKIFSAVFTLGLSRFLTR